MLNLNGRKMLKKIKIRKKAAKKFQDWANSLTIQANPDLK